MSDSQYLALCRNLIEKKLYPDQKQVKLKQRDFNYLSVMIEEASGVVLSLSTMKRLWASDVKQPHPSTLNALVSVLGFKEWNDFKLAHQTQPTVQENQPQKLQKKTGQKNHPRDLEHSLGPLGVSKRLEYVL